MPFPLRRVQVVGPSMVPATRHGDHLLVWFGRRRRAPRPGDVVVVRLPGRPLSVKRVVAVDGDAIRVEGDNPFGSTDSRDLGALSAADVAGRVLGRVWPRPGRLPASPVCENRRRIG